MVIGGTFLTSTGGYVSIDQFGLYRPNITIVFTLIAVAVSFAWLAVEDPALWKVGTVLYVLGSELASPFLEVITNSSISNIISSK